MTAKQRELAAERQRLDAEAAQRAEQERIEHEHRTEQARLEAEPTRRKHRPSEWRPPKRRR